MSEKNRLNPDALEVESLSTEDLDEVSGGTGGTPAPSAGCPVSYSCGCHFGEQELVGS